MRIYCTAEAPGDMRKINTPKRYDGIEVKFNICTTIYESPGRASEPYKRLGG